MSVAGSVAGSVDVGASGLVVGPGVVGWHAASASRLSVKTRPKNTDDVRFQDEGNCVTTFLRTSFTGSILPGLNGL
jgi:hypothetical protein